MVCEGKISGHHTNFRIVEHDKLTRINERLEIRRGDCNALDSPPSNCSVDGVQQTRRCGKINESNRGRLIMLMTARRGVAGT